MDLALNPIKLKVALSFRSPFVFVARERIDKNKRRAKWKGYMYF